MRLIGLPRTLLTFIVLALPLLAIDAWLISAIGGYGSSRFFGNALFAFAFAGVLVLFARWRVAGSAAWIIAWLAYVVVSAIALAEAVSFYFQGSSFNDRFFANLRLTNLRSALDAFPALAFVCVLLVAGMCVLSGWLLARQAALRVRDDFLHGVFKAATLLILAVAVVFLPSSPRRLSDYFITYFRSGQLVFSEQGRYAAGHIDPDPVSRDALTARAGKNLLILYMESLERIYTDNAIFPGLTPNLNRYRAQGLDFAGHLSIHGATFTMAGLFASQCGAPYFNSPWDAFQYAGNDNNDMSFQPELVCLGDVLHLAGYRQVFINGSPLAFADQGEFFRLHGYDQVYGLDELEAANGNHLARSGWGLYDSELFALAAGKFHELAASGKPFNLSLLTIDNHPPHGRPSPGCPPYAANPTTTLQSVHCTDFLVGRFLDALSKDPAWKNTVVVVMSDHLSMPNDAWPLYPRTYLRRPLLFILNAGRGVRNQRFYHMDIAPTVLDLMGVHTNADFIAGADRSAANAPSSPLADDPATVAVLKRSVWALAQPIRLCRDDVLVDYARDTGFQIGQRSVPISRMGVPAIGIDSTQKLALIFAHNDARVLLLPEAKMAAALTQRGNSAVLLFTAITDSRESTALSVDWLGRNNARAHLADVPRLDGLRLALPDCAATIRGLDRADAGSSENLAKQARTSTATLYPPLPRLPARMDFRTAQAAAFERNVGWHRWQGGGSWTSGSVAALGFRLPRQSCHAGEVEVDAHPFLTASRPELDVQVLVNGRHAALWQIGGKPAGVRKLQVPVTTADAECRVDMLFRFLRPHASPPPYPAGEDPRPLQLEFVNMHVTEGVASKPPVQAAVGRS